MTEGDTINRPAELPHLDDRTLAGLGRLPLASHEQMVAWAKQAEAGALAEAKLADPDVHPRLADEHRRLADDGKAAFANMVNANIRLAAWMARRRLAAGDDALSYLDLTFEGVLGLIRAAHKWDHRKGLRFSTYATHWVGQFQQRAARRARGLPVGVDEQLRHIRKTRNELTAQLNATPDQRQLADAVGLSARRIAELETWAVKAARLDAPLPGCGSRRTREQVTAASIPADSDFTGDVRERLAALPERQRQLLTQHFGLDGEPPQTRAALARRHHVPQALVDRALDAALARLRDLLTTGQAA